MGAPVLEQIPRLRAREINRLSASVGKVVGIGRKNSEGNSDRPIGGGGRWRAPHRSRRPKEQENRRKHSSRPLGRPAAAHVHGKKRSSSNSLPALRLFHGTY